MARRLARLEATREAREEALVSPDTLRRMAEVAGAEYARIHAKLLSDGQHEPMSADFTTDCEARRILREKLLRDDPSPAEPTRV